MLLQLGLLRFYHPNVFQNQKREWKVWILDLLPPWICLDIDFLEKPKKKKKKNWLDGLLKGIRVWTPDHVNETRLSRKFLPLKTTLGVALLLDIVAFDSNTSFPKAPWDAVFVGLASELLISSSYCFCSNSGRDVCSTGSNEALPSKRLEKPENELNRAIFFGGSSSTEMPRI